MPPKMTQEAFQANMGARSKPPEAGGKGDNADVAAKALIESDKAGKLDPLKPLCDEMGCSPEEMLVKVQKDPQFAGKTPQEIADMVAADPTLKDKLKALVGEGENPDAEGDAITAETFSERMKKRAMQ